MEILQLFLSPAHVYVGHFGGPAGETPIVEVPEIECVAGRGIRGDRYLDHKPDYKGQITFFEMETHRRLCEEFGIFDKGPEVFRRNVITSGQDLNDLIGVEFEVQGAALTSCHVEFKSNQRTWNIDVVPVTGRAILTEAATK